MKKVLAGFVLLAAAMGGTSIGYVASADGAGAKDGGTRQAPHFSKNRHGQSFGKLTSDLSIDEAPDLVAVVGDDGAFGYVEDEKLFADDDPASPEEALQEQAHAPLEIIVPVYASDGSTVVDTFTIAGPESGPIKLTQLK